MRFFAFLSLLVLGACLTPFAAAQPYPGKPVRIFQANGASGPPDVVLRGAAQALSQALGQQGV